MPADVNLRPAGRGAHTRSGFLFSVIRARDKDEPEDHGPRHSQELADSRCGAGAYTILLRSI